MARRPRIFPKDLVQFPWKSHWHQIKSVLLPCPPHRISPLWEKHHLSSTEQMSHLNCQTEITRRPVPYTSYRNKIMPSSWLQQPLLMTESHFTLPYPRAMAVPLPHLQHHKHQETTPVLPLHHKHDTKGRVTSAALKPVSQCHMPPLSPRHQTESFVESNSYQAEMPSGPNHLPKISPKHDHSVAEALIHSNQQPLSSSIADHQDGLPQFLNQRTTMVAKPRTRPDYLAKDMRSIPRRPGNQVQTSPRPGSQARAATAAAIEFFHLQPKTKVTPATPCSEYWSRASAMKTLNLDHWVLTKAPKVSYPNLHLKETISLLRCIDHHSKTLAKYPFSLNQRTRPPNPPNWAKGILLSSLGPNYQSKLRPNPQSSGISGHWRKATSVPFSLHHHIPDVLPQHDHDDQVKDVPAQLDQQETVPSQLDVATALKGHVHWTKPLGSIEHQEIVPHGPYHQAIPSHSHDHQAEDIPDPNTQIILQKDLDWKAGLHQEVTNPIILEHQAMHLQGLLDLQDTTSPNSKNQTTLLTINDHQVDGMPNSSVLVRLQEEADNWETGPIVQDEQTITPAGHHNMILPTVSGYQVVYPPNLDFQAEDTSGKKTQSICPITKDHWQTRLSERELQTTVITDQGHNVISSLGKDYQDTGLLDSDNPDTPPLSYDYMSQNAPELIGPLIYQQKLEPWEIISLELDHHMTVNRNQGHWETLPVITEHQDKAIPDPRDQDTRPSVSDYQNQNEPDFYDSVTVQQKWESSEMVSSQLGYHVTTSVSQDHWGTRPLDIGPQAIALPCPDDQDIPPSNYGYQDQDRTDPKDPVTCQQKLELWKISPALSYQITAPTSQEQSAKPPPGITDPDDVILSGHKHQATHPPTSEQQLDSPEEILAWNNQVPLQQEPLKLNYQVLAPGQAPQGELLLKLEQQDMIPSGPDPKTMSSPSHDDQTRNMTYSLAPPTIQMEQGHGEIASLGAENGETALTSQDHQEMVPLRGTEYPEHTEYWTHQPAIMILPPQHHGEIYPLGLDHKDMPLCPPSPENLTSFPLTIDHKTNSVPDANGQITVQLHLDSWETMPLETIYRPEISMTTDHETIATLGMNPEDTSFPGPQNQTMPLLSSGRHSNEKPDLNDQVTLQSEQDPWRTMLPRTEHQTTTSIGQVSETTLSLGLDCHKGALLEPEQTTALPCPHHQAKDHIPDTSAQDLVQTKPGCLEAVPPEQDSGAIPLPQDSQANTFMGQDHPAPLPPNLGPQTPFEPETQSTTPNPSHQTEDVPDYNAKLSFLTEQGPWQIMPVLGTDQQAAALIGHVEAIPPAQLDSQDMASPGPKPISTPDHWITPSLNIDHKARDRPDTNAQALAQPQLDPWETIPPDTEQQVSRGDQDHKARPLLGTDPEYTSFPDPNCWVTPPFHSSLQSETTPEPQTQIISPFNVLQSVKMSVRPHCQVTLPYLHTSTLPDPLSMPEYQAETKSDFTTTFLETAPINLRNNQETNPPNPKYRTILGLPSGSRYKTEILIGNGDHKTGAGLTSDPADKIESELLDHTQPEQNRRIPRLLNYIKPYIIEGGGSIPTMTVQAIINSIPQQTIKNDICKQLLLKRIKEFFTRRPDGQISCKYMVCLVCASWIPNGCHHINGIIKYPCGAQLVARPTIVSSSEKEMAVWFVLKCPQTLTHSFSDPPNTFSYSSLHNHPLTFSASSQVSPVPPQPEKSERLGNYFQPQERPSKPGCQQPLKKNDGNRDEEPRRGRWRFFGSLLERFQRRQRRN